MLPPKCPQHPLQDMYVDDRRVWNSIFERVVQDLASAQRNGIFLGQNDGSIFPIVIGNKGDWSYLEPWLGQKRFFFTVSDMYTCYTGSTPFPILLAKCLLYFTFCPFILDLLVGSGDKQQGIQRKSRAVIPACTEGAQGC